MPNCSDCRNFSTSFEHLPRFPVYSSLTSTPTLNCFPGQLDPFWVYYSHTKGNTEITNCYHKHYVGDKKGKPSKIWGPSHKLGGGVAHPGPSAEWRRLPLTPVYSLTGPGGMEGWVGLGTQCTQQPRPRFEPATSRTQVRHSFTWQVAQKISIRKIIYQNLPLPCHHNQHTGLYPDHSGKSRHCKILRTTLKSVQK